MLDTCLLTPDMKRALKEQNGQIHLLDTTNRVVRQRRSRRIGLWQMKRRRKNQAVPRATDTDRKSRGRNKPEVMMPAPIPLHEIPETYGEFLVKLKERISSERFKVILSANSAMVLMYWDIGQSILERQHNEGWGAKVIDRLSHDLKTAFPDMSGFSPRNLKYMRKFAESWPDKEIVQEVLAQITWYHNLTLLEKNKESDVRLWYAHKTIENGWSRNILAIQIETRLHERQGRSINNFPSALPPADSDMAAQIFKDCRARHTTFG